MAGGAFSTPSPFLYLSRSFCLFLILVFLRLSFRCLYVWVSTAGPRSASCLETPYLRGESLLYADISPGEVSVFNSELSGSWDLQEMNLNATHPADWSWYDQSPNKLMFFPQLGIWDIPQSFPQASDAFISGRIWTKKNTQHPHPVY